MADIETALITAGGVTLGAVIAAGVGLAVELVRAKSAQRELEAGRQQQLDDLQRQTLMEAQDAVTAWAVVLNRQHQKRRQVQQSGASWEEAFHQTTSPEEVQQEMEARLAVGRLIGRLRDEKAREQGRQFVGAGIGAVLLSGSFEDHRAAMKDFSTQTAIFEEQLAEQLKRFL